MEIFFVLLLLVGAVVLIRLVTRGSGQYPTESPAPNNYQPYPPTNASTNLLFLESTLQSPSPDSSADISCADSPSTVHTSSNPVVPDSAVPASNDCASDLGTGSADPVG